MKIPYSKPGTSRENKTGSWRTEKPVVDKKNCIKCNMCVMFCPEGCIDGPDKNPKEVAKIDYDYCKGCGICANVCPPKCIKIEYEEK